MPDRKVVTKSSVTIIRDRFLSERNILAWERDYQFFENQSYPTGLEKELESFRWHTSGTRTHYCEERFWICQLGGCHWCHVPRGVYANWCSEAGLVIPTHLIVIPLTLISAYLLLSKPRTKPADSPDH